MPYWIIFVYGFLMSVCTGKKDGPMEFMDILKLFREVTALTMAFNTRYGKRYMLPTNAYGAIDLISDNSNTDIYMDSDVGSFGSESEFVEEVTQMIESLNKLIRIFLNTGFIDVILNSDMTPAIMFDIDNTIEFTSMHDDYSETSIEAPGTVEFIKNTCFVDGIICYFITARTCNIAESNATQYWLMDHLGLTEDQVHNYVYLAGSIHHDTCTTVPNERVSYKEVLRRVLKEEYNIYWIMSIGDQMTDWFGEETGLKVWYPNRLFDSSIVENVDYALNGELHLQTVTTPTEQCYNLLKNQVLKYSSIAYCSQFTNNKYISPNIATNCHSIFGQCNI